MISVQNRAGRDVCTVDFVASHKNAGLSAARPLIGWTEGVLVEGIAELPRESGAQDFTSNTNTQPHAAKYALIMCALGAIATSAEARLEHHSVTMEPAYFDLSESSVAATRGLFDRGLTGPASQAFENVTGYSFALNSPAASTDATAGQITTTFVDELRDFSADDWDGEGAKGISSAVVTEVERVLAMMPKEFAEPEVAPAVDGSVCMEWDCPLGSFWLDIGADKTAQTLIKVGSQKVERRFAANAPDLKDYLCAAAARMHPGMHNLAIRRIMAPS